VGDLRSLSANSEMTTQVIQLLRDMIATSDEFIEVGQVEKSVRLYTSGCAMASDFSGRRREKLLKTD
jgi:hypothetical protein